MFLSMLLLTPPLDVCQHLRIEHHQQLLHILST
jgi:hypothetical protein